MRSWRKQPAVATTNGPAGNAYFRDFSCCYCWHKHPTTVATAGPATAAVAGPVTAAATSCKTSNISSHQLVLMQAPTATKAASNCCYLCSSYCWLCSSSNNNNNTNATQILWYTRPHLLYSYRVYKMVCLWAP